MVVDVLGFAVVTTLLVAALAPLLLYHLPRPTRVTPS